MFIYREEMVLRVILVDNLRFSASLLIINGKTYDEMLPAICIIVYDDSSTNTFCHGELCFVECCKKMM